MIWLWAFLVLCVVLLLIGAVWAAGRVRERNVMLWLPSYIAGDWPGRREPLPVEGEDTVHVMFCLADHFEPGLGDPALETERRRVSKWLEAYPKIADLYRDADGRSPRQTFFFPSEQYRAEHLDRLSQLVAAGFGEVEVHLHHDGDTAEGLRGTLDVFVDQLREHGHLGTDKIGRPRFGFVHGNWALDNSLPDGRWCGVNDELRVLRDCGCYADFTLPSAPSASQTHRINSIYYAVDDPERPRSHDDGVPACFGRRVGGDLLIVQGPLSIQWPGGRWGLLPRLENGNLSGGQRFGAGRVDGWIETRVCVSGKTDWVFVKVHTHGCDERNWEMLFGKPILDLHNRLTRRYNDGRDWRLHYVTTREMYNIIRAAELGLSGDPGKYRDLEIAPPAAAHRAIEKTTFSSTEVPS